MSDIKYINENSEYRNKFNAIMDAKRNNNLDEAEQLAKEWRKDKPRESEAWRASAIVYAETREFNKALVCLDFAKSCEKPHEFRNSLQEAKIYIELGDYEKADSLYKELQKKLNDSPVLGGILVARAELSLKTDKSITPLFLEMIDYFNETNPHAMSDFNKNQLEKIKNSLEKVEIKLKP